MGRIFDIQRYSIHDGNGIRTLVFMKGCPLHCKWCANPEGICPEPGVLFVERLCIGCGRCAKVCETGASVISEGQLQWNRELCDNCMKCVKACPPKARRACGTEYTVDEVLDIVSRDATFYRKSGGGMTVGGGEPLMQHNFVSELLRKAKQYSFNQAIETSGYGSFEALKSLVQYADQVFMDIKHMDTDKHFEATGVHNSIILDNIKSASKMIGAANKQLIIRIPVIPGINDSKDNIAQTAEFVRSLDSVERLELLPYHSMGEIKYTRTTWTDKYSLTGLKTLSEEAMNELKQIVISAGVRAQVGG